MVDLRLVPETVQANLLASVTLEVQVEANGQEVSLVQVGLAFDPAHLQAVPESIALSDGSPLNVLLNRDVNNDQGIVTISAGRYSAPLPSATFRMARVTFNIRPVEETTAVEFISGGTYATRASVGGANVTRGLFGATVTVQAVHP